MNTLSNFKFNLEKSFKPELYKTQTVFDHKSPLQKTFGSKKLHKSPQRLIREKIANTGQDPTGSFREFAHHDIIQPLSRALKTSQGFKPELDVYPVLRTEPSPRRRNYPLITEEEKDRYRTTFLKTDHISLRLDNIKETKQRETSLPRFLDMKARFNTHTESLSKPMSVDGKTMSNTSSVKYNIINMQTDKYAPQITEKRPNNMRKGLFETFEENGVFHHKLNKDFQKVVDDAPKTFYRFNGIFSYMYDSAFRNGNLIMPFKVANEKDHIHKKVDYLKFLKGLKKDKSKEKIKKSPKKKKLAKESQNNSQADLIRRKKEKIDINDKK